MENPTDTTKPFDDLFDDPAAHKDERYSLSCRDKAARRKANLSLCRWKTKGGLSKAEERELIHRAQAIAEAEAEQKWDEVQANRRRRPLYQAGDILVIHHHKSVLSIAGEYFGDSEDGKQVGVMASYEDRVAGGLRGLWVAIRRFNRSRLFRLNASAEHWIRNAIREECRLGRKRGDSSDTRADRKVYDNRHLTAHQIAALTTRPLCSNKQWAAGVKAAQEAIDRRRIYWHGHDGYNEGLTYDELSKSDGERWSTASNKYSTRHDFKAHYDSFNYGQPSQKSKCLRGVVDALVIAQDRRSQRWLTAMGRRHYALWLLRRDKKPVEHLLHVGYGFGFESCPEYPGSRFDWRKYIAPNFPPPEIEMAPYSINTAATASDSKDWKSYEDRIAEASKKHPPQVWNEKQRGVWRTVDLRAKNESNAAEAAEGNDHDSIRQQQRHEASGLRSAA
jgi:hypothetical protein